MVMCGGTEPGPPVPPQCSVAPRERFFSGIRVTIPKKEQSDRKWIPNGDISPLREKV